MTTAQLQDEQVWSRSRAAAPRAQTRAARRAALAQFGLELGVFSVAAAFVAASAVNAKRSEMGPLLAALESSSHQASSDSAVPLTAASLPALPVESDLAASETEPVGPSADLAPKAPAVPAFGIGTHTPAPGAVRYFDGRPLRVKKSIWMTVTAYSPDARSCGDSADGRTATNHSVWTNGMSLVAADPKLLPYGSIISVPGYAEGEAVPVLDCGGAIKGHRLDVLYSSHAEARRWGVKRIKVTVWEYADKVE